MTGSEAAMTEVRQSLVFRPLSSQEAAKLANILKFASREPALALLCWRFSHTANGLHFLHNTGCNSDHDTPCDVIPRNEALNDAATEYRVLMETHPHLRNDMRRSLTEQEERECVGSVVCPLQRRCACLNTIEVSVTLWLRMIGSRVTSEKGVEERADNREKRLERRMAEKGKG